MDFEPVFCLLCLKRENPYNAVNCEQQPEVVPILCRQFWFSPEEIQQKYVCGICWTYVDDFNNFYEQIKMIHDAEEQEVMALEDDSIQCEENDINETEISLEEESCMSEDKPVSAKSHVPDPLMTQTNVETIVIESIDIDETFKEAQVETENDECVIEYEERPQKYEKPKSDDNYKNTFQPEKTKEHSAQYTCDECNVVFSSKYLLNKHRKQHAPSSPQYTCTECEKFFASERRLQQHRKKDHGPGLICDICSKWFKTAEGLHSHQKNCPYPQYTDRVECTICKRWLKNTGSLKKHMVRHKTSDKPNICEICGKVAPTYTALKSHKLFVHEMQKTFRCLVCKKAFKRAFTLKEHMTVHTGNSLYNCPHCTRTFNSSANLHAHKKKKHPKEWQASRNEYEKRFMGK